MIPAQSTEESGARNLLEVRGVSKSFGPTKALDDISFEVQAGTIHALLGGNGSGKSTLIKILTGVYAADAGKARINGHEWSLEHAGDRLRSGDLRVVHQQPAVFPELSVAENLAMPRGFEKWIGGKIAWKASRRHAREVLERFDIEAHPDQLLGTLSPARQTMVAIARALQDSDARTSGVLLLDEPTASLPAAEVEILLSALRRYAASGQSILFVSHRLDEVRELTDRATLLRDGRVVETVSPREISQDDLVELMMGRKVEEVTRLKGNPLKEVALRTQGLIGGPLRGIDLSLYKGEIIGIAGLLGSGRSSLLRLLFGLETPTGGEIWLNGEKCQFSRPSEAMRRGIAFVPEERARDAAFPTLPVRVNLSAGSTRDYWRRGVLDEGAERRDSKQLISDFLIKTESEEALLQTLSGGNQQKVILARWLRRKPQVLLLDEPTQGVDVLARSEIFQLVHRAVSEGTTALVVSSDFEELAAVCNRVLILNRGSLVATVRGDELSAERLQSLSLGVPA